MIQVCSQCGTRWNVRDRQRVWCPRCRGTLLAPSDHVSPQGWDRRQQPAPPAAGRQGGPLPAGYRWVAVRPGAPPQPRRGRRELGPTPHYLSIPRWGLVEHFDAPADETVARKGPAARSVQTVILLTMAVLGAAAFVHLVRYILLIINRTVLLNPWVAGAATWGGVAISVVAAFAVVASAIMLANWLIARRGAAFAHLGQQDPRRAWVILLGCLVPVVNLLWAPVYVIELTEAESRQRTLQRPILVWWVMWILSTAVSVFSLATSFTTDPQGIADNTVTTTVAYLFAAATLLLVLKVFLGFERQPVERPSQRWVMVEQSRSADTKVDDPARAVETGGENPAA